MEILKSQLPSRGILYNTTPDTIVFNVNIEVLKLVSACATTNETKYMIDAIMLSSNITDPLTMGDYYFCATLLLSITKPIDWSWKCKGVHITFNSTAIDKISYFNSLGFIVSEPIDGTFSVTTRNEKSAIEPLSKLKAEGLFGTAVNVLGSRRACNTEISSALTPSVLMQNITYLNIPEQLEDSMYEVAQAAHIDEYRELMEDQKLVRLLPAVCCLPTREFGVSLKDRLNTLRTRTDALSIFSEANEYAIGTKHGINKLLTNKCPECYTPNVRSFAFSPEQFF